MDLCLESEGSGSGLGLGSRSGSIHEHVDENDAIAAPEKLSSNDEIDTGANGSVEHDKIFVEEKGKGIEVTGAENSPPSVGLSPVGSSPQPTIDNLQSPTLSTPSTTKGKGLRKWRRIRRDVRKEGGSDVDISKNLKRDLSNSGAGTNSARPVHSAVETKENSGGSVSSTNAILRSQGALLDSFGRIGNAGLVIGSGFAAGTDSENSEDWSSKSSTAASGPKLRFDMPMAVGLGRDRNRMMRSMSGKNMGATSQQAQRGKGWVESSKKARGERVKIEKENSHSSVESDSRSYNFTFMQEINSPATNGRESGEKSINYKGENSDEAQGSMLQGSDEIQAGFGRKDVGESGNSQEYIAPESSWDVNDPTIENHRYSTEPDPLAESMCALHSAQEALEKEVLKFKEFGEEDSFSDDSVLDSGLPSEFTSVDSEIQGPGSLEPISLKSQVVQLKQSVNTLESKLEKTETMLKMREAMIDEVEACVNTMLPKEKTGSAVDRHQYHLKDMETELEGLFMQKIEAEVEYLAISRTIQKLRTAAMDHITLMEEQKVLASDQTRILNKLDHAQSKAAKLGRETKKLENHCEETASAAEALELKAGVSKYTSCLFVQFVLLLFILGLLILQLSPLDSVVVPT